MSRHKTNTSIKFCSSQCAKGRKPKKCTSKVWRAEVGAEEDERNGNGIGCREKRNEKLDAEIAGMKQV